MNSRLFTILAYHLVERARRLLGDGRKRVSAATTVLATWLLIYSTADRWLTIPASSIVVPIVTNSLLLFCLFIGVYAAFDCVRPGGSWGRLAFYPLRRADIVFTVVLEALATTVVTVGLITAPVFVWMVGNASLPAVTFTKLLGVGLAFVVAVVAWSLVIGLAGARFVGERWLRSVLELLAGAVILLGGTVLARSGSGIAQTGGLVGDVLARLPTGETADLMIAYTTGSDVSEVMLLRQVVWAVIPCLLLLLMPVRRPLVSDAHGRLKPRHAATATTTIAAGPTSLVRASVRAFYAQLAREPSYARYIVFVSISLTALCILMGHGGDASLLTLTPGIVVAGLFMTAVVVSSIALPVERGNIVFLRLASIPIRRLLGAKLVVACVYPSVLAAIGVVVLSRSAGSMTQVITLAVEASIAVVVGAGLGVLSGAWWGRYDWIRIEDAIGFTGRTASAVAGVGVIYAADGWFNWPVQAAEAAGIVAVVFRLVGIIAAAGTVTILCVLLAEHGFQRRR